ncbi:MAG TPA: hypothetical protein VEW69_02900, partial [Alphaproteobacteria bacterium]|nr:hypothetical protein [Alphaproteobacteria bacterium]
VEAQMEAAQQGPGSGTSPLTDEQKRRRRERDGLILARTNLLQQMEAATHALHKESLRRALSDLEKRIAALEKANSEDNSAGKLS